jgi:hypothetical protein
LAITDAELGGNFDSSNLNLNQPEHQMAATLCSKNLDLTTSRLFAERHAPTQMI